MNNKKNYMGFSNNVNYGDNIALNMIAKLNNAINNIHTIPTKDTTKQILSHESLQVVYNEIFTNKKEYPHYNNINEFIANEYEKVAVGVVKSMRNVVYITKTGETVCPNYDSLKDIFTDCFLDDLKQETALFLLENVDKITIDNAGVVNLEGIILGLFKHIRTYLYNNKQRIDNKCISIVGYDEENDNDISIAINSRSFIEYQINALNNADISTINNILDIVENVKKAILLEYHKCWKTMFKILDMLLMGIKKKDICSKLEISDTTLTKHCNNIKMVYYNLYHKPTPRKEHIKDTIKEKHCKILIDTNDINIPMYINADNMRKDLSTLDSIVCIENINRRQHDEKARFYSSIWYNIELKYHTKYNDFCKCPSWYRLKIKDIYKDNEKRYKTTFKNAISDKSYYLEISF